MQLLLNGCKATLAASASDGHTRAQRRLKNGAQTSRSLPGTGPPLDVSAKRKVSRRTRLRSWAVSWRGAREGSARYATSGLCGFVIHSDAERRPAIYEGVHLAGGPFFFEHVPYGGLIALAPGLVPRLSAQVTGNPVLIRCGEGIIRQTHGAGIGNQTRSILSHLSARHRRHGRGVPCPRHAH
jgi:hypothetical protein